MLEPLFIKSLWKPRLTHSRWLDAWALSRRTLTVVVEALPRDFKTRSWTQQTVIGEYLRSSDSELFNVCWRLYSEFKKNVVRTSDKEIKKRFYSNICKKMLSTILENYSWIGTDKDGRNCLAGAVTAAGASH
jgi:hypothetical protein